MSLVLWSDATGLDASVRALPAGVRVSGIVAASNRPQDHAALARVASALNVPMLIQPARSNAGAFDVFVAHLVELRATLFLVNSYSMILPERCFTLPPHGTLNVHGGLLPSYRGANVLNWVLVNAETRTGVTIHRVDAGIDTGPIVAQREVAIRDDDTALSLRDTLARCATDLLREVLPAALESPLAGTAQDNALARAWPRRTPDDGRIDWSWSVERIYNLVRALVTPWPGAWYIDPSGTRVVLDTYHTREQIADLRSRLAPGGTA